MTQSRIPLRKEQTGEPQSMRLQTYLADAARVLNQQPFSQGNQVGPLVFTAGSDQVINHRLKRAPTGFICIDVIDGYGSFRRVASNVSTITVRSENACSATFWVY